MTNQEKAIRSELIEGSAAHGFRVNYLVEAGAGAGKTYTMVHRIANQLMGGDCTPEELVAITFTVKSTQEMKQRLDKLLRKRRDETADSAEKARLEELIRATGRMQISTIHGLCQTMLETMPFHSPFGVEMTVMEEDGALCRDFFRQAFWAAPAPFDGVRERFGLRYSDLEDTFFDLCHNGEAQPVYAPAGSPKHQSAEAELKRYACRMQEKLHDLLENIGGDWDFIHPDLAQLLQMDPAVFAAGTEPRDALVRLQRRLKSLDVYGETAEAEEFYRWLKYKKAELKVARAADPNYEKNHPLLALWQQAKYIWEGKDKKGDTTGNEMGQKLLRDAAARVIHTLTVEALLPLTEEWRREKVRRCIATYDDLLLRARDMLRDSDEARDYFHRRWRVVYVDEFQDTDPVQAELLFYLTARPDTADPADWRRCRPEPGSLFLVGDPKQAIYRFRGADIDVYNSVKEIFEAGGGTVCQLNCNFRSSEAICKYTHHLFAPPAVLPKVGTASELQARFTRKLDANGQPEAEYDPRQAEYAEMLSDQGQVAQSFVFSYCARRTQDFVPSLDEDGGVKLDKDGNPKMKNMGELTDPAQVAAFIRTMVDKQVDLPEKQEDGSILLRPARWKDFLVLTRTKGNIRSYAAALTALDIPVNVTGEQRLGSVGAVRRGVLHLQAMVENWNDLALVQVLRECYRIPLEEIRVFLQRTGLPSLRAALTGERLEAIHAALKEEKTPDEGMLKLCAALQELAQLRQMPARMPAMSVIERLMDGGFGIWDAGGDEVARRREYARVQQYLELVRAGGRHSFAALAEHAIRCAEQSVKYELPLREENDQVRIMNLHQAKGLEGSVVILAYSTKGTDRIYRHVSRQGTAKEYACVLSKGGIQASVLGWPEEWNGENLPGRGSEKLTEKAYLDAEKLRLQYVAVTRAAYWLVVCGEAEKWDMKGGKAVCSTVDTGWSRITNGGAIPTLAKVEEGISDPGLKAALQSLSKGQCAYVRAGAGGGVTQVSPQTLETALDGSAAECAEADSYAITPSKLDHASRSASLRKDRADGQGNGAQTAPQQGGDIPSNEPRGADWGTIVHRIMELAVRSGQYDPAALETFARQAVEETLPDGVLTKEQRRQLLGGAGQSDPGDYLARRAAQAAGFLSDPKSCLRRLMDGSACYPELPFILTEADRSSDLYRHVSAHIGDEQAQGKTLELQGILDLAIRRQDGSWMVVDYKTDRLHAGETPAQLEARLRQEYTAQILSYVRILERLNMGAVTGAYLCSVPLGGKLVELPLQEGVRCPVSVLRPDGRGYDPCIAQAGGAHGFSLLLDGKEVTLTDSRGNTGTQFKMCRRFAEGVSLWLKERYPAADCSVDMTNAGSVVVLKRLLNTMKRVLPADEWKRLEIRWNT